MRPGWQPKLIGLAFAAAGLLWAGGVGGGKLWPLLFVALIPLVHLASITSGCSSFIWGTLTGLLHFVFQMYWIISVLKHFGGLPLVLAIPALLLLAAYLGLYFGLFCLLFKEKEIKGFPLTNLFILPLCWVGLDWLRGYLFTGLPWMDIGYNLSGIPLFIQTADLFGHHAVTFLIIQVNIALYLLFQRIDLFIKIKVLSCTSLLLLAAIVYGDFRLSNIEKAAAESKHALVGVVQGNIDQSKKWSPENQKNTINKYILLSESLFKGNEKPGIIIWPETALPFFPSRSPYTEGLVKMTKRRNMTLLTGSPWFHVVSREPKNIEYYNSSFLLSPEGEFTDFYYKSHLVPFGEYVPFKRFLFFLAPLVEAVGDFTPGKVERPLSSGDLKSGVLICFESIFPKIGRDWINNDANILVNLTNDAWYGRSSAPEQSWAMSIFRAVENRRSLVRAANTGISGFVEPTGKIIVMSDIFVDWAFSAEVPLLEEVSFFTGYGFLFAPLCFVLLICNFLRLNVLKRKK